MVADIDYATNIVNNDDTIKFFDSVQTKMYGGQNTNVDDLYSKLMQHEDNVLYTINRVAEKYETAKRQSNKFWNVRVSQVAQRMTQVLYKTLQLCLQSDAVTIMGLLIADSEYRIYVGIWLVIVAVSFWALS